MKIVLPFTLAITLLVGSCTTESNIYYNLDPRYSKLVPDYSENGIAFSGDNGDTLRYKNFIEDYNYVYSQASVDGKQVLTQHLDRRYESPVNGLSMRFTMESFPDRNLEYASFTNYEFSLQYVHNLVFTESDTSSFGNLTFIGDYTVDGVTYNDVYADPEYVYFSLNAGYLKFRLGNGVWFTKVED